ncbi:MAG: IS630 family transposase [Tabrizicola sp.]|nr:IS630 family transposase [Tabrizicola sp.]
MVKAHPIEIRSRVIDFVEEGHGHREAARHFRVSPRFVNDMVVLKRESGGLEPKALGGQRRSKLSPYDDWMRARLVEKGDLTLDEIVVELASVHCVAVHRGSVGKWLHRLGLSHEKTLLASEQLRPDVAERRRAWIEERQPVFANMLERLVFIDETSLKTNLVKTTGWALVGQRLIDHAPFGHWNTQTFIAGLGHDGLIAPWVLDGAMNSVSFETYVEKELAPALKPGQVVVADNLSSHKSPRVVELLAAKGCTITFLPPYSPDLNPIEMAFSKLKTLIRKAAARTYQALWKQVGRVCDLFTSQECSNYFRAAGYGCN